MMARLLMTLLAAGCLSLWTGAASASESRMNSLCGSPLVMDMTDIADFPGLLTIYGNAGFVTVKPLAPTGNAGLLVGINDIAFGVWVLRDPRFDDIATADAVFDMGNSAGVVIPDVHNVADLFFGMSNGFGLRASVGAGLESVDAVDDGDVDSTGASALSIEVQPGFTLLTDDYQGDFGLGVTVNHYAISIGGDDVYTGRLIPSVLLRHRSTIGNFAQPVNWVVDFLLTRRSYSVRHNPSNDKGTVGDWLTTLMVGPRLNLPGNFTVTAGLSAQFEARGGKLDGDRTPRRFGIGTPGLMLAAELLVREILAIRAGVDYGVYWGTVRIYDADDDLVGKLRLMGQRFNWSAGLGLRLRAFEIDGTLSQQLILDGPDMIGGRAPGFLGMLSATYRWL